MSIHCPKCNQELQANPQDYENGRVIYCMFCATAFQKGDDSSEGSVELISPFNFNSKKKSVTPKEEPSQPTPQSHREGATLTSKTSDSVASVPSTSSSLSFKAIPFFFTSCLALIYLLSLEGENSPSYQAILIAIILLSAGFGVCINLLDSINKKLK